jgi:CSLREA domain-containing protein
MKTCIPQLTRAGRRRFVRLLTLLACATCFCFLVAANNISNSAGLNVQAVRVSSDSTVTPAAGPLTLFVNTLGDADDTAIGDGHCDTDGNIGNGDQCTLRAAIQETNSAATGADIILFILPPSSTITLSTALPDIAGDLTINGPGANTLRIQRDSAGGTPNFRPFTINSGTTVTISGLTIANGSFVGTIGGGGGVLNSGTLTLTNSTVSGNRADVPGYNPDCGGGGIFNSGTLTLTNSMVSGNTADLHTGGGGGIFNSGGTVTMTNSAVSGNFANSFAHGGGILCPTGTVILTNSTVSGNAAGSNGGGGGGIYMNNGTLTLTNSTVSDNSCNWYGSGIRLNLGTATLTNVTVSGNTALSSFSSGYGISGGSGTVNLKNTIVANNKIAGVEHNLLGAFTSQDYNLIGDTSDWASNGTTLTGATAHNILNQDAKLGPLANYGGPTPTAPPLPGSPAIDAGNSSLTTDQRGQPRPLDDPNVANAAGSNGSDIGAFESMNLLVNSAADSDDGACDVLGTGTGNKDCTLREAIGVANAQTGAGLISFAPALTAGGPATITLSSVLPNLSNNLTIAGPAANLLTVRRSFAGGTPNFRIFTINSGKNVTISGLTITNGNAAGSMSASAGGGILNDGGTLLIDNCVISGNSAAGSGGGVNNGANHGGTLTINNSTVSGNTGGGVDNTVISGSAVNPATLTINNSTISGNTSNGLAAGIQTSVGTSGTATATINNSTISRNISSSSLSTGGVYNAAIFGGVATLTINNSTISGNISNDSLGTGGIHNGGTAKLTNTIVAGNLRSGSAPNDFSGGADPSSSFNLFGTGGSGGLTNGTNNNQVGVSNPGLGALANNGGPTQTHALLPGSPAINAGNNTSATAAGLTSDQRGTGFPRISNSTVDIGAFESRGFTMVASGGTPQSTNVNTAFSLPLLATVNSAFGEPVGGGTITFTAPGSGASGSFPGGATSATVNTNSSGVATAQTFTANNIAGPYNVNAGMGAGLPTAAFALTNKVATATVVSSSANPSNSGQSVTFTAKVTSDTGAIPIGTVQFKDGGANLGSPQPLDGSGLVSFTTSSLVAGIHVITVDYGGDASFAPSGGTLPGGQKVGSIIQLDLSNYSVNESDNVVTIKILRSGVQANKAQVSYATDDTGASTSCGTSNGMASSRCDFTTTLGTVDFGGGGPTPQFVTVPITRDSYNEGRESFTVQFSNPQFGAAGGAFVGPTSVTITINDSPPPAPNATDDPTTFVRQHYHDFLNREPDQAGLDFWVSNFTQCNGDPQCLTDRRINVSAAFFLSIEFQDTGYLVERIYKTAYGDATGSSTFPAAHTLSVPIVRPNELLADSQEIGQGIIVGQGSWQKQLEDNKKVFTEKFVQRSQFTNLYGSMSNAPFVDALNTNAGNPLSPSERNQLVNDLNSNAKTQAQVLQAVAEHPNLVASEFNRAFVLMQFFGYLRRNPSDPQDTDYTGYDFWLTKLNSFTVPGDDPLVRAQKADMVKAFITSTEYRQRFGP